MNPFILPLKTYKLDVRIHKHSAYQIVFSEDNPFDSVINSINRTNIYGFLIKPQVSHLCSANESTLHIMNIEPYSQVGFKLKNLFKDEEKQIIFSNQNEIAQCFGLSKTTSAENLVSLISEYLLTSENPITPDERIIKTIEIIKSEFSENLTPKVFADKIFLSPSRLASLFKEVTGSSIGKYILWIRLRHAITTTLSNKQLSLTEIAYESGFYDLPQFDKYMNQMFGVSPKGLKKNSDLIQVL